jgi:peptidoglycan/LPS O-acetylase OafA/YrhL
MTNSALRRTHQIDGLRAVAVGLVVFHHSLNSALIAMLDYAGFDFAARYVRFLFGSGVELFFVSSGIVLLRPYLRDGQSFSRQAAARYYRRRVARLWPPYLAALAVAGLVMVVVALDARTNLASWLQTYPMVSVGERNLAHFLATRSLGLGTAMLAAMALFHMVERRFARGLVTANAFWPARRKVAAAPA